MKHLQYYFDSKKYTDFEINQSIEETKNEFSKQIENVDVYLNEFGVYVVTFYIHNKKKYLPRVMKKTKREKVPKNKIRQTRLEKYYGENRYGKYKQSDKTYLPY